MKNSINILYFLLLLLTVPSVFAKATSPDQLSIEQQVEDFMAKENIPAMAIGIIKDGKVLFTAGFGVLD